MASVWSQTLPDGKSLRTIHKAKLLGLGIVDSPAYVGSLISQRALEYALGVPEDGHRRGFGHMAVTVEQLGVALNLTDENTLAWTSATTRVDWVVGCCRSPG